MVYLIDNLTDNDKAKYRERSVRAINGLDMLLSDISIILNCKTINGKYFTIAKYIGLSSDNTVSFYNYFMPTKAEIIFLLRFSNHNNTNPNFYNEHERNGRPNKRWVIPFHGNVFQKESPYEFLQAEQNVIHYPVNALDDEFSVRAFLFALRQLFINGKAVFPELPQVIKPKEENNQQTNEHKTMNKKQIIKLNESQLRRIVSESVNRIRFRR